MRAIGHGQFQAAIPIFRFYADRLVGVALPIFFVAVTLCSGCARFQLPAIDPNGSRIFLPFPSTTQLNVPRLHDGNGQPGILPTPAFSTPAAPPPCLDGSVEDAGGVCNLFNHKHKLISSVHDHFRTAGKAGEIQLTPLRVVAPVGGEVVLLAGICGEDGYLVKREPIEWMLSPDSVGQFIDVGDDSPGKLAGLMQHKGPKVEKLDVDFARGRTSSNSEVITRGTAKNEDDIKLREGETWLSISSPSEGVSRVTVLAPDSDCWDRRRQTATIYWVDAEWQFPTPQLARTGETIQLVTRVTKSENLVPATDWIVRYTILDPSLATFLPPTGSNVSLVKVNSDGQAIAQLAAPPGARGATPVAIEVIRPAQPSDSLPELVLGRGQTIVTFSSPGLVLQTFGPEISSVGEQLTYAASLGNPGDIDAENVRLEVALPAGTKMIAAAPSPTSQTNSGAVWDQGILGANRQLDVSVVVESLQPNTFDVVFLAQGAGLTDRQSVRTQIIEPSVDARFAPIDGVSQAEVGNVVEYGIDITNTGRQTLTDLTLTIESAPGLPEAYKGVNKVEQSIPMLQPGSTASKGIAFRVQQEGQQAAKLTVRSGSTILAEKQTSILGLPPRPKKPEIGVSIEFPQSLQVGQTQLARITLRNPGEVKLTDLKVELTFDQEVEVKGYDQSNRELIRFGAELRDAMWTPPDMLPRMGTDGGAVIRTLDLSLLARAPAAAAAIRVRATAAEGVEAEDVAQFQVIGRSVEPPSTVNPPNDAVNPPTAEGGLVLEFADFNDPTIVGSEVRYGLRVTNNSSRPDRNVHVELKLPQGVQFNGVTSMDGSNVVATVGPDNTILFPTTQYMRPRPDSTLGYVFVLVPTIPQSMVVKARVYSDNETTPIEAEESTTVTLRTQ
jgi:uncharacterized repeat protein (TIGR01451 family)